jgi:glycosyltransferase involved in cell wall biosynthesis
MAPALPIEPKVSIVIPCRNERHFIEPCLASTLSQQIPDGSFEVIIADGQSTDGTRQILNRAAMQDPRILVLDNPGRIVSSGLNAAIRVARGKFIVRMDAHTECAADYVLNCIRVIESTSADNVGGPWSAKANGLIAKAIAAGFQSSFAAGGARSHNLAYEGFVDTVYLGCWRKETFDKFGYFDEELVRNQDDEHNLRIIRGGGKVYQSPKIKSWYKPRGSLAALFKQYMQYGYWKVRVIQKHKLPASWRHLVPGAFVPTLVVLSLLSAFSFLLSRFDAVGSPWSVVHSVSHFSFQVSAFSFLLMLSAYALCVLFASLITAAKTEWKLFPVLPLVFPCYHFGYGFGFLRGVLDFAILRTGATSAFTRLTRTP